MPYVQSKLATDQPFVVLAESFSGPLAFELAATHPANLVAVVLCASFVTDPAPSFVRWVRVLIGAPLFKLKPAPFLVRHFLLGQAASVGMITQFMETVQLVKPAVLASRIRSVFNVDARATLRACQVPLLYLGAKHDRVVRERSLAEIKAVKPDIEVLIIDGPHFLLQDNPGLAIEALEGFVRRVATPANQRFERTRIRISPKD